MKFNTYWIKMKLHFNIFCYFLLMAHVVDLGYTCPEKCKCIIEVDRHEVDCSRQLLDDIPPANQWPDNIFSLDMSMNKLKHIVLESNDKMKYLDLATNMIENIEPGTFDNLPGLIGLDLSHNEMTSLPTDIFTANLQTLNLSYNNIEILPSDIFQKTTYLQELRLAHNPLRMLDSDLFKYSGQLKTLDLSGIESFALKDDIFHYLYELNELDLSDNDFMLVPIIPLRGARKLKILRLSGNPIQLLDEYSFVKLETLNELYLDDMKGLVQIKEKTFSYLYNLKKISISNNAHLSYVDQNAFYGTFNRSWIALKEANFRANRLSTLKENTLPFCNLTSLDLRENPWTCDCHLLWAKYCHLRPELTHGIFCANPSNLRGNELDLVDHSKLHCEHNQYHTEIKMLRLFIIVFVSFTIFFIGVLFLVFIKREQVMRWWTDRKRGDGAIYYVKAHTNPIDPIDPEF